VKTSRPSLKSRQRCRGSVRHSEHHEERPE
jgi:hypothetical protein